MTEPDLDELARELSDFDVPQKPAGRSPREERIIAGFEDIQRFVEEHGHAPQHGEGRDIFERLYAVRLDRLRSLDECRAILAPLDHQGLLGPDVAVPEAAALDEDALAAELAEIEDQTAGITDLRHVRPAAERRAAEEIANRQTCRDFGRFKPLFEQGQKDLDLGLRTTRRFVKDAGFLKAEITAGQFFILGGQIAYVAEGGKAFKAPNGETDARLRVVFSNGTESDLLLRSLQRALYKDEAGRRITEPTAGPLFADRGEDGDEASGTIYVLRSRSDHPFVSANRELVHKIGVTGSAVETRIADARNQPTFLLADVEVVATYSLYNIARTKLENLIHRIFEPARLEIQIEDRFGRPVVPREWYFVPLFVIDEAVEKIRDGTITDYVYDPEQAALKRRAAPA